MTAVANSWWEDTISGVTESDWFDSLTGTFESVVEGAGGAITQAIEARVTDLVGLEQTSPAPQTNLEGQPVAPTTTNVAPVNTVAPVQPQTIAGMQPMHIAYGALGLLAIFVLVKR